jgi:hypothetical protein
LRNKVLPRAKVLAVTAAWKLKYPDAFIGVLAMRGVMNPERHPILDEKKAALEKALRDWITYAKQHDRSGNKKSLLADLLDCLCYHLYLCCKGDYAELPSIYTVRQTRDTSHSGD